MEDGVAIPTLGIVDIKLLIWVDLWGSFALLYL